MDDFENENNDDFCLCLYKWKILYTNLRKIIFSTNKEQEKEKIDEGVGEEEEEEEKEGEGEEEEEEESSSSISRRM